MPTAPRSSAARGGTLAATAGPDRLAGAGARIGPARVTKSCQIVAGSAPPVTPLVGELSSLPTQTPTTSSGVKPMNQASRQYCLVPGLPADGPAMRAALAAPSRTA